MEQNIATYNIDDPEVAALNFTEFNCGDAGLDDYLSNSRKALNDHKGKFTNTTVLVDLEINKPIAYITTRFNTLIIDETKISDLTGEIVESENIPELIPCIEVINVAVTYNQQERGYGSALVTKILDIALEISQDIGCRYVFLWSKRDYNTVDFYKRIGFKEMIASSSNDSFLLMRYDLLAYQHIIESIS